MGKQGKKKGAKKEVPKEETPPVREEQPSTSVVEEEDEGGLTGASRKKKAKQEKKEKSMQALQALQATKKPSTALSETTSEASSRAQSLAPSDTTQVVASSEPSSSSQLEKPVEPPKTEVKAKVDVKVEAKDDIVEQFEGLGVTGSKKKRPKKKKAEDSTATSSSSAVTGPSVPSSSSQIVPPVSASVSAPALEQMPAPVQTAPPAHWGKGAPQSAGRGRGWRAVPSVPVAGPSFPVTPQFPQAPPASQAPPVSQAPQVQQTLIGSKLPQTAKSGGRSLEPVLCRYKIPLKIPGNSVRAAHIKVLTNYLEMDFKALQISRYDVSFSPDRPKKMLPQVFQIFKQRFFPNDLIAFDQMKNCYSLRPLKDVTSKDRVSASIEVTDQNRKSMTFDVAIKATGVVDLANIKRYMTSRSTSLCQPTEEIQCIDVILRQGALESYVKAGRQFFKRPAQPVDLGYGYEMWTGLFQSAIFTSKAFINIDVAHKGFPKAQSLIDALVRDFNLDPTRPIDNQRGSDYFFNFVKGLKVVATIVGTEPGTSGQRREFICNSLVGTPDKQVFTITEADGSTRKSTVADYFAKEKKYKLKYPHLNCLWVGARDRCIFFPMELLHVAYGQALVRQLNEVQVSKMVREAATPPHERLYKIKEVISNMKYSQNKDFKQFGLEISDKFYQVKAKILEPPTLEIGNGKTVPRRGQWQANRLLKPEPLQSWGVIAVDTDPRNEYDSMISMIISTGTQMGMNIARPSIVNVNARMTNLHSILLKAYNEVRFVFIIMSSRGRDDYHKVKQMAEREVGILTQCLKEMTVRRMNPMTAKNILLKVNSKLMGINQAIEQNTMPKCLRDGPVMIVGADVTHPSPDQSNIPSIAAVTASIDPKCYIYNIELSVQTPKKEMIVEFEDMIFDHLKLFKEKNNFLPKKIFVFRDGVSEGQFSQVMNSELQAVYNAYQRMAGQVRPEILFLLVQKRHHTRLFSEGGNSHYNVEPGTVVDTDIVHASELDFYLVSHQAIKGTARPTRYHAVCNEGKIPDDEVEQLTFYLCHLYSRCTRSVSYPTPTYYAHLACLRARSLTYGERFDNRELERKPKRLTVLSKMLQFSRMFFV